MRDAKAPHIIHSGAHPNHVILQKTAHYFEIHIQGRAVSQLSIDVPNGIKVTEGVDISNQYGKKIDANVPSNNGKYTINFAQPVPIETILSIFLNGIITDNHDSNIALSVLC
ncbi:hypothetical protein [Trichormus azollae]|uniref:Uncharacterized protein n=1 Tax=Nostoc azollae (strain 0708) TaxID=551115 RepID=D7DXE5_NOSA0|nr:hypothetical protein [Trichormus azollae]ADI64221.1 conserved hypothetical protein ['Nostoc azollae' 0708]